MIPEINIWAVLLATVASMAIGAAWYSRRVFGNWWAREARVPAEHLESGSFLPIIIGATTSFLTALVFAGSAAIAQEFYGGNFLANSLVTALILWVGFTAARFATHDTFEGRPRRLTLLTLGYELVTILVMALIIGLFGISAA